MTGDQLRALEALRLDFTLVAEDVWRAPPYHVDELHHDVMRNVAAGVDDALRSPGRSPVGVAVQGQKGAGKTHLLGLVRQRVQAAGGYFFLVNPYDGDHFWETVAQAMLQGLGRDRAESGERQLTAFLRRLCERVGALAEVRAAVTGEAPLTRRDLTSLVGAVRRLDPQTGLECQDVLRALVLLGAAFFDLQDIGHQYLLSLDQAEQGDRSSWGIHRAPKPPQQVVQDISRLLALTGPSVVAVDQIDALVAQSVKAPTSVDGDDDPRAALMLEQIAGGLMALPDLTRRTLTVVSCLPDSWQMIRNKAVETVTDRFREALQLRRIPSAEIGREVVERRFRARYQEVGYQPPYPTWPVDPAAFADAPEFTPRGLLQVVDAHIQACLRDGEVRVLARLLDPARDGQVSGGPASGGPASGEPVPRAAAAAEADFAVLDAAFARLREAAATDSVLTPEAEDTAMPELLAAGLTAWITERGAGAHGFVLDPPPGRRPALHARLRRTVDERIEAEEHWGFRAIAGRHARAVQCRIRDASIEAGLAAGVGRRRLFLLRNTAWPTGPVTREVVTAFTQAGGATLPVTDEDLRTFAALRSLLAERHPSLPDWLRARQPATRTALLRAALAEVAEVVEASRAAEPSAAEAGGARGVGGVPGGSGAREVSGALRDASGAGGEASGVPEVNDAPATGGAQAGLAAAAGAAGGAAQPPEPARDTPTWRSMRAVGVAPVPRPRRQSAAERVPMLTLGVAVGTGVPARIELESLRKHVAIFAGSGSGKTVLVRHLVEQCALLGVSAIVLDANNDLARLGDPWPEPPPAWGSGDAERAAEYLAHTDVVVWTPGRTAGRPLSFQPLPAFDDVLDDPDEFRFAVDAAVAALAPRARVDGTTVAATRGQAVLREALRYYARQGRSDLTGFVDLLADLPEGVSALGTAPRVGAQLAETLRAAMVNDPLFGGDGTPVDPGLLLTPPPGRRARVSVISLAGLPGDDQRQGFVNQLQMALFAWAKRHPAGERPLGGLLVMDEAQTYAPSGALTPSTESTIQLASQIRKYGLGLVFATQAPKGLHNQISGNAATQLFGFLNAPAQIAAAHELARAKGSSVVDISRLRTGEFYLAATGLPFQKIRTPLCLSHHPASPLNPEEVLQRARATGDHLDLREAVDSAAR